MQHGIALILQVSVRSLGVLLDSGLWFDIQVMAMAWNDYYQLRLVCQFCPFLDKKNQAMVTYTLVTSRPDYCNGLYVGWPLKMAWKLQLVQSAAV